MTTTEGADRKADKPNWWQRLVHSGWGQAVRWLAVLGLVLGRWAAGQPSGFAGWVPVLIISVLLLLPDADSVAFGGVKLEMRRAREEVEGLRQQVTQLQVAQASAGAIGNATFQVPEKVMREFLDATVGVTAKVTASEGSENELYDRGTS